MSRNQNEYQIYYHVGLGKAASTFLHNSIFPFLEGIKYIHRDRYRRYGDVIERTNYSSYLVSREAALRLTQRLDEFAAFKPDAKVILILRRHDTWIASHYRRYLKNGGSMEFDKYVDLSTDKPLIWGEKQMRYMSMIKNIEDRFNSKPLILFSETLQEDPFVFLDSLCKFTGSHYHKEKLNFSVVHRSWNEKQLKFSKKIGSHLFAEIPTANSNPTINRIQRRLRLWTCYGILGFGKFLPERFVTKTPLIDPKSLIKVRKYFEDDWLQCHQYAKEFNHTKD